MKYVIITPGGTLQYDVPLMKVQSYSLDEIFEKGLLMLLPFYIFSHEKSFPEYNSNEQKLAELKAEYQIILKRLDELERRGAIGAFDKRTIIDLSGFLCNLTFIKSYLCIILKKPYCNPAVRQTAFTFNVVFFLHFSQNPEIRIRDTLFIRLILLVYKMLIGKKLNFFFPRICFPKNLIDDRNNQFSAII